MKKTIKETIIVEGKYDKIRLSELFDANIIQTDGFSIFKNKDMVSLIAKLADETGVIILTDSDRAGFLIRNYIKNCLAGKRVLHAFIPSVEGKEKRKDKKGKEGLLGVEGMRDEALIKALSIASCESIKKEKITKQDLYKAGLAGQADSRLKREALLRKLELPTRMSANTMLSVINALFTKEEFFELF
ncbi:MAG: DUF4093 domain-containing protein [Ruminococcaceae bacterium]|nr:DUF4093 domain-containing protein [Oscillospiraceae bacterium]